MASHAALQGHHHVLPQSAGQQTPQSSQMAAHSAANNGGQPQLVPVHVFSAAHPHHHQQQHPHQQSALPPSAMQPFPGATQTMGGHLQQQHHQHPGAVQPLNGHMVAQHHHHQLPPHHQQQQQHQQQSGMVRAAFPLPPGHHHHPGRMVHHQHLQGGGGIGGPVQHSPLNPLNIVTHSHPLPSQSQMIVMPQGQQPPQQQQPQPGTSGTQLQQVQQPAVAAGAAGGGVGGAASPVHIRFYGHEQRTVIPREVCLIGCVFYIAPSYTSENEATSRLVAGWKRRIEKFGGRVVDQYVPGPGNNVTHVVTENMNGGVQKLALADNRRCVSVFWLDDTLGYERLLPPWRFYHLPFAGTTPCKNMVSSTRVYSSLQLLS